MATTQEFTGPKYRAGATIAAGNSDSDVAPFYVEGLSTAACPASVIRVLCVDDDKFQIQVLPASFLIQLQALGPARSPAQRATRARTRALLESPRADSVRGAHHSSDGALCVRARSAGGTRGSPP